MYEPDAVRLIFSMTKQDRLWLSETARLKGVSMAEVIRWMIARARKERMFR